MKYCLNCILPGTRPNLRIGRDGVCDACKNAQALDRIDWTRQREWFMSLAKDAQDRAAGYECVIPVSGGKDSTWQVVQCLDAGLRPLAVTWRPPGRTALGQRNLDNLVSLGVDHIDFSINPETERQFATQAFLKKGDPAIPMHLAIFAIPLTVAVRYRVPLVVWGEDSGIAYGGSGVERLGAPLDGRWLARYGVSQGTRAEDWAGPQLPIERLTAYRRPDDAAIQEAGVRAIFLGHYHRWDPSKSLSVAESHGFRRRTDGPATGLYDFADIDDSFIGVHHYLKWHKFGFTRLQDNLSLEIRAGRITREEAIKVAAEHGDDRPQAAIEAFCSYIGITERRFDAVADGFRNADLWTRTSDGWRLRAPIAEALAI